MYQEITFDYYYCPRNINFNEIFIYVNLSIYFVLYYFIYFLNFFFLNYFIPNTSYVIVCDCHTK